ncbi:hypothetical protein QO006_004077 [Deinococcus enclensis]|uniref:Uncharacterized protein n=1 Tax=Deinococcus enclensis TaxID=1049582 RepID=A0ABT9MJ32_9DEIO|nr:hypothetical protein [Deinococcus enclensis]
MLFRVPFAFHAPPSLLLDLQSDWHRKQGQGQFAIPLFRSQHLAALEGFFGRYGGNPPSPEASCARWQDRDLQALAEIVGQMPLWHTSRTKDEPAFLEFDRARLPELTEGWIPVITPYGPGILMHQNSD